jgi:D-beta-D-heptose 7-phosphate kinase/D-beta-D-heptose 1-phosphate adenosyltransferase
MNLQRRQLKVTLIGDTCIDEYHYGSVERISPEAPVPIFVEDKVETKSGMASNVAKNLEALGVNVTTYFGVPSTKIRMIDSRSNQHILRIDKDVKSKPLSTDTKFDMKTDAFVVSDYDKGFVSYELIERLILTGKLVFIDTKKTDLQRFSGAIVKINSVEYKKAKTLPDKLIVTNGAKDVIFGSLKYEVPHVEITDVCGAGDTFLAAFAYRYINSFDYGDAIKFAIQAASVTVKHIGVYAPTLEEILCQGKTAS